MISRLIAIPILFGASVVAQLSPAVVCVAGQCLQGYSNTTIGVTISASGAATDALLLPGQYTSTTNPQLLHSLLTSSSASLSPSPGFANSSSLSPLPLNVDLQPGLAVYSSSLYAGQAAFSALPSSPVSNTSTPLSAGSLALSSNVWAAVNTGSNNRIILWEAVPNVAQLPASDAGPLALLDLQSAACSPTCSGSGVCSAAGTCVCPPGFAGSSCETCASGFFGPTCQPCPVGCTSCDQGISGSGRCLVPLVANAPSTCNCLNGQCGSNGQCACNPGWTTAANGTACAQCSPGFFLTSTGNCQICANGCTQCADSTGACISCKSGFTQDADDATQCLTPQTTTSTGVVCPDGSFGNAASATCTPCSPVCAKCTAGTSNDCTTCASGHFSLNGNCVTADANGVCSGTTLIADNVKKECNTCGAKCTSCQIPGFSAASTINQAQCTGCLPGFVLSQGQCIGSCPSGTFVSPQDNVTCTACDSSCSTCTGSSTFCLSCPNNQLASNGKCVTSCPSNTFSSAGACIPCHPDCASCSGNAFNQCSSCSSNLPVLSNGRCLPTCTKTQFFDKTSSSCSSCDSSCSSCSGSGPTNCLACSSSTQVLRSGSCVSANCNGTSNVIPGLGVCLSELVSVLQASGTSASPLPSITGLSSPISTTTRRPLEWWEILLMALGCAFIFLVILMLWRRRARKQRAKRTAKFASAKALDQKGWRGRLMRFGERLFGHKTSRRVLPDEEAGEMRALKMRVAADARHDRDIEKIIGSYEHSRSSRAPSPLPSLYENHRSNQHSHSHEGSIRLSSGSMYSEVTGMPRRAPEPRQPVKKNLMSRFSSTTLGSSIYTSRSKERDVPLVPKPQTEAEAYAMAVRPALSGEGSEIQGLYWMEPVNTGTSSTSRNPFRK